MRKLILSLIILLSMSTLKAQNPELVEVQGGTFIMGNNYAVTKDESPEHKVTLSDFLIGKYEVTFEEFDRFCTVTGQEKPYDAKLGRGKKPVMNTSWESAVMYCNWLSKVNDLEQCYTIQRDSLVTQVSCNFEANGYRLPTEAEWEYAAKGGNKSKKYAYSGSFNPNEVAWFYENSDGVPHFVGKKESNELGIHDMSGNVREWCWDYYSNKFYSESPESNPSGPVDGIRRVFRGGGWNSKADLLRLTARESMGPNKHYGNVGFRVVRKK